MQYIVLNFQMVAQNRAQGRWESCLPLSHLRSMFIHWTNVVPQSRSKHPQDRSRDLGWCSHPPFDDSWKEVRWGAEVCEWIVVDYNNETKKHETISENQLSRWLACIELSRSPLAQLCSRCETFVSLWIMYDFAGNGSLQFWCLLTSMTDQKVCVRVRRMKIFF